MEDKCGPRASEVGIHPPRLVIPGPERILPYGGGASREVFSGASETERRGAKRPQKGRGQRSDPGGAGKRRGVILTSLISWTRVEDLLALAGDPVRKSLGLAFRQARFAMEEPIGPGRHFPFGHNLGRLLQEVHLLLPAVLLPHREVQFPAAALDVVRDQPGDWGYLTVPGPACLIGMTIQAGARQKTPDLCGCLLMGLKRLTRIDGVIGPFGAQQLNPEQQGRCED